VNGGNEAQRGTTCNAHGRTRSGPPRGTQRVRARESSRQDGMSGRRGRLDTSLRAAYRIEAMPQPLAETTPSCPQCAAYGPIEIDERVRVRVDQIHSDAEVYRRLGSKWPESMYNHAIRVEGLKAHYFTKPVKLRCAFEERSHTPHHEGYIVETACGLLLNVGVDCAFRWIKGISIIERVVKNTLRYDRNLMAIGRDPLELQLAIADIGKRLRALKEAKSALIDLLPAVSKRMREASENARHREVITRSSYETEQGRKTIESTHQLRGWELWTDAPPLLPLEERLTELREDIRREREADGELNAEHESLARRIGALHRDLRPCEDWADRAARFFAEDNLRLVIAETKQERSAEVDGQSLIVRDDKERVRIDANGRATIAA